MYTRIVIWFSVAALLFWRISSAHTTDPSLCAYWLHQLERISVLEEQLMESSEWAEELEPGAMDDWNAGLRRQIKNEMEAIERECR